jgi:hypothetical protein
MARQDEAGPAEKPNRKPDDSHDRMSDDWIDPSLDTYLQITPRERLSEHLLNQILTVDLTWATPILVKYCATKGRKPHPPIAMLLALIYQRLMLIPSWRELSTHLMSTGLWVRLGFKYPPSHHAFADFTKRVGPEGFHELFTTLVQVVKREILARNPFFRFAEDVSIDATLVKAWAQYYEAGQKHRRRRGVKKRRVGPTDKDADWGVRGLRGGKKLYVFGYKLHAVVESQLEIPLQFTVSPANRQETRFFKLQLMEVIAHEIKPKYVEADAAYCSRENELFCHHGDRKIVPVIAFRASGRPKGSKKGRPLGKQPKNKLRKFGKLDGMLPFKRNREKWKEHYNLRWSIERVFSRLKQEFGLTQLKVRSIERVTVHFALALIAMLAVTLTAYQLDKPGYARKTAAWRH